MLLSHLLQTTTHLSAALNHVNNFFCTEHSAVYNTCGMFPVQMLLRCLFSRLCGHDWLALSTLGYITPVMSCKCLFSIGILLLGELLKVES